MIGCLKRGDLPEIRYPPRGVPPPGARSLPWSPFASPPGLAGLDGSGLAAGLVDVGSFGVGPAKGCLTATGAERDDGAVRSPPEDRCWG